ncbi:hypothetical protein BKA70DRAFT_1303325, partial [Coprinopsis sp. MPI-PUGE-AT-0042]
PKLSSCPLKRTREGGYVASYSFRAPPTPAQAVTITTMDLPTHHPTPDVATQSQAPESCDTLESDSIAMTDWLSESSEDLDHATLFDWSQDDQRLNRWEYLHAHPDQDVSNSFSSNKSCDITRVAPLAELATLESAQEPAAGHDEIATYNLAEIEHHINTSFASPPLLQQAQMPNNNSTPIRKQLDRYAQRRRTLRAIDAKEREIYETKQRLSTLLRERTDYDVFMAVRGLMIA